MGTIDGIDGLGARCVCGRLFPGTSRVAGHVGLALNVMSRRPVLTPFPGIAEDVEKPEFIRKKLARGVDLSVGVQPCPGKSRKGCRRFAKKPRGVRAGAAEILPLGFS